MEHEFKKYLEHGTWHFTLEHGTLNMKIFFCKNTYILSQGWVFDSRKPVFDMTGFENCRKLV